MAKPTLATCSLAGCFGCHMSLLDLDERLLTLLERVELDRSPFDDKKAFDRRVDLGLIEGGCANTHDLAVLRDFRAHCTTLVAVGACAITGGVPALRNTIDLRECFYEAYLRPGGPDERRAIPDDPELPLILDRVLPAPEVVPIEYVIPGCPPSADAIWAALGDILAGRAPRLSGKLLRYD